MMQIKQFPFLSFSIRHNRLNADTISWYSVKVHYPFISQFRECIHNDTKHNVQTNGGHYDEEG